MDRANFCGDQSVNTILVKMFSNPFHNATFISCPGSFSAKIYDISGKLVKEIEYNEVVWNGKDEYHKKVPAGIFFICLETLDQKLTRKLIKI